MPQNQGKPALCCGRAAALLFDTQLVATCQPLVARAPVCGVRGRPDSGCRAHAKVYWPAATPAQVAIELCTAVVCGLPLAKRRTLSITYHSITPQSYCTLTDLASNSRRALGILLLPSLAWVRYHGTWVLGYSTMVEASTRGAAAYYYIS